MLSSRRQSLHPSAPQRRLSPFRDPFYWHQHSSASQPVRRPSDQSSVWSRPSLTMTRIRPEYMEKHYRRSSCISRLGGLPPKVPASVSHNTMTPMPQKRTSRMTPNPLLRGYSCQSQRGETIQEVKETPSPVKCHDTSAQDSDIGDVFIFSEVLIFQ